MVYPYGMRRLFGVGCIAIVMVALAFGAYGSPGKASLQEISEGLTCQCGCGLTVANCNHPQCEFSVPIRQQIESMIAQGMGKEQIIGLFRTKYGEKILSAPTVEGFNLLAWIVPFAVIFAGCFIIVGAVNRWRANLVLHERASPSDLESESDLKGRLEQEVREQH